MNKKLKFALINRSGEQGFAIPIAVGLGLIMILIATTLVIRSQGDQVSASAQKSTAQSLSVTETGITRVQAFLNKHRGLANKPYPWTTYLASRNASGTCTTDTLYTDAVPFDDWTIVGTGNDRFKVISYTPNSTGSILVLEGQSRQGTNVKSTSRLQVNIPFDRSRIPSFNPPGAWAENFVLGNNQITGNVVDAGCPPGTLDADETANITDNGGTVTTDSSLTLPPALPVPTVCTVGLVYPTTCGAMSLPTIDDDLSLPRTVSPNIDVPNVNNEYVYYVAKNGSNKSIELSGSEKLIITPGTKVKLYVEGNIDTGGGGVKVGHNCYDSPTSPDGEPDGTTLVAGCEPTNFQILGGTATTSVVFGGSNTVDAFIFAPNAVASGVNGSAQIRGSIWLKEWDGASANHNVISQTGSWNNIPSSLWPPRIAPLGSWERQVVP